MCDLFSSRPLFLGKIGLQKVFGTFLDRKVVFPDDNNFDLEYKNIVLWKLVNVFLPNIFQFVFVSLLAK